VRLDRWTNPLACLARLACRLAAPAALAALAMPSTARAQTAPPPAERLHVYSPYEQQTIDQAMLQLGAAVDPSPQGKLIERIDIVPLDVIEPRDPAPRWINVFHWTSRPYVIRREMLEREGDAYQQALVDDTIRNLRRLPQLSLVLVVAAAGTTPDRVRVVVITKDVWSLRPNWDIVATAGGLELLEFQPAETNVFGTHQTASGHFALEPSATTFGLGYSIPRLAESRIAVVAAANVMVNRASGAAEGTYGSLVAGQPLYSGKTEWAWDASVAWQDFVFRRYENAQLSAFVDPGTGPTCTASNCVPFQFRAQQYATTYELRRSFGWEVKHDFTLAAGINHQVYSTNFGPGADPRTVRDFVASQVPTTDTRVGPSLQYHSYTGRYLRVIDFETLALQEDYRLGHDVVLRVYPSFRALGATRDVIGFHAAAQYSWPLRDGLARVSLQSTTEPEPDHIADASIVPTAHLATPTFAGLGRIVLDATLLYRWRNHLNQINYLGGDDRLRGYPTNFFVGKDVLSYNVEFRSRPVEVLSCQLGGVAFYDVGDAFDGLGNMVPFQSVGLGLRALFPQLDRVVFRVDVGFPVERPLDPSTGETIAPYAFLVSFGQAFPTPTISPLPVLPTGM
jgi:hypothetical protein